MTKSKNSKNKVILVSFLSLVLVAVTITASYIATTSLSRPKMAARGLLLESKGKIVSPDSGLIYFPYDFYIQPSNKIGATYKLIVHKGQPTENIYASKDVYNNSGQNNFIARLELNDFDKLQLNGGESIQITLLTIYFENNSAITLYDTHNFYTPSNMQPIGINKLAWCAADTNNDGVINIFDTTYLSKIYHSRVTSSPTKYAKGDTDGDGLITILDLTWISKNYSQPVPGNVQCN